MGNKSSAGDSARGDGGSSVAVVVTKKGKFTKLSSSVVEQKLAHAAKLGTLSLQDSGARALPLALFDLASLRLVDLSRNELEALPRELGRLACLKTLHANGNKLRAIAPEIGDCGALEVLSLQDNELSSLPRLPPRLRVLTLGNNKFGEVPGAVVASCGGSLRELSMPNNRVSVLPPAFAGMAVLEELNLDGNGIATLEGVEWGRMGALRTLQLRHNALTDLPEALLRASGVNKLELAGNRITYKAMLASPGVDAYNARRKERIDRALAGDIETDRTYCGLDKTV
jgi:Leucine-rich repeat (LRR) protein